MSIKEMWNYLIFQTKGYRQLGAAIVAGAVCGEVSLISTAFSMRGSLTPCCWNNIRQRYIMSGS